MIWPLDFKRVPDEEWTKGDVDSFALQYDAVKSHGWYQNLNPTVEALSAFLKEGDLFLDYSGGTGILEERFFKQMPASRAGCVIMDSSAKFLRLALEKFQHDERAGFRLIRFLKEKKRLQYPDEILNLRFNAVVSSNAIHLYYDLQETLKSWYRILKPGARVFVQSGNIRNPEAKPGEWIIDETVEAVHQAATRLVQSEPHFAAHRDILSNNGKMAEYDALRRKYFLPVRPLSYYVEALESAGFSGFSLSSRVIRVNREEWGNFLSAYHEGILGWVGGVEKIEGKQADQNAVRDRITLIRNSLRTLFPEDPIFDACWTYIECKKEF